MPEIKADEYSVLVIICSTKEKFEKGTSEINERQKEAVEFLRTRGKITISDYKAFLGGVTEKTAYRTFIGQISDIFIAKARKRN